MNNTPVADAGSFESALTVLKSGKFVRRRAWRNSFLALIGPHIVPMKSVGDPNLKDALKQTMVDPSTLEPAFEVKTFNDVGNIRKFDLGNPNPENAKPTVVTNGWTPGIADLLANDWVMYSQEDIIQSEAIWQLQDLLNYPKAGSNRDTGLALIAALESLSLEWRTEYRDEASEQIEYLHMQGTLEGISIGVGPGMYRIISDTWEPLPGNGNLAAELEDALLLLRDSKYKMSDRKFHRTVIAVEVLSDDEIPQEMPLDRILDEMYQGDFVGRISTAARQELNAYNAAGLAEAMGSSPDFFGLSQFGEDVDE